MFFTFLSRDDAERASEVVAKLLANGFRSFALTGGLAIEAHLRAHSRATPWRALSDMDLVVEGFDAIPRSLGDAFLLNHIHPHAREGKLLIQLVDPDRALRVDVFRAFGASLSRAGVLEEETGPLRVLGVEDLVARVTALVCGRLRKGRAIDVKHVRAFTRLAGMGQPPQLTKAWEDHRQDVPGTLQEATEEATRLIVQRADLLVSEAYSTVRTACKQCEEHRSLRLAAPDAIVKILGYS